MLTDEDIKKIALEVWRYDQHGQKSQAWAYLQRGAAPVAPAPAPVNVTIPDEQIEAAIRKVLADIVGGSK